VARREHPPGAEDALQVRAQLQAAAEELETTLAEEGIALAAELASLESRVALYAACGTAIATLAEAHAAEDTALATLKSNLATAESVLKPLRSGLVSARVPQTPHTPHTPLGDKTPHSAASGGMTASPSAAGGEA